MSRTRPKVAVVSSVHRWTDNRIHFREAASLASAGYDVTLVAVAHDLAAPDSGITVIQLPARRRLQRIVIGSLAAVLTGWRTGARVFHLHDPELVWAIPVLHLLRRKVIYDAHEDLPTQTMHKHYLAPWARPVVAALSRGVVRLAARADHVIVATESIAETFPPAKTSIVHNYPRVSNDDELPSPSRRLTRVVYVGALSTARGTPVLVDALAAPDFPVGWTAVIAGGATESGLMDHLASRPGWEKVYYPGIVAPEAGQELMNTSRVGLVVLEDTAAHRVSLPTKMFEYFAAGIPVIASDFPLWRDIVESGDCGVLVDPGDPAAIARAVSRYAADPELLDRHGRNARKVAMDGLNWSTEERTLLEVYSNLLEADR